MIPLSGHGYLFAPYKTNISIIFSTSNSCYTSFWRLLDQIFAYPHSLKASVSYRKLPLCFALCRLSVEFLLTRWHDSSASPCSPFFCWSTGSSLDSLGSLSRPGSSPCSLCIEGKCHASGFCSGDFNEELREKAKWTLLIRGRRKTELSEGSLLYILYMLFIYFIYYTAGIF